MRLAGLNPVELPGQIKILLGQTAGVVSGQGQCNLVPTNIDIGMMSRFLSRFGDGVHELHGCDEVLELIGSDDDSTLLLPIGHRRERAFDLGRG